MLSSPTAKITTLFRHDVTKVVEPGETWLSYGSPDGPDLIWRTDPTVGRDLTELAWAACRRAASGADQPARVSDIASRIATPVEGVAIGLYADGYLASGLADRPDHPDLPLAALISEAADRAVRALPDIHRTQLADSATADGISLVLTVLHDREDLGESAPLARFKVRPGVDALSVRSATGSQTLLPAVGPYNGWNGDELVRRLEQTPTGATPGARWSTCRTASWVRTSAPGAGVVVHRTEFGFTTRPLDEPARPRTLLEPMAEHILRRIERSGLPAYEINAVTGERTEAGTTPRVVHALASLAEAGRILGRPDMVEAARTGLQVCLRHVGSGGVSGELALPGYRHGGLADCVLLDAALRDPELRDHPAVDAIGRRLANHHWPARPDRDVTHARGRRPGSLVPARRHPDGRRAMAGSPRRPAAGATVRPPAPLAPRAVPRDALVGTRRLASAGLERGPRDRARAPTSPATSSSSPTGRSIDS